MKKVKEGYKMSELGEIPIEWQIKSINDICYVNPDTLSNKSDDSLSLEYIDIESVTTRRINEIKKLEFKDAPSRARRLIKRNDVIMSTVRPYLKAFAKINIEKDNLVCSTGFAVLRAKKNINHEFLFQSILSDYYIQQLSNKMVGSNYPAVNSSDVRESNIILPPLEEQEKIASILSTVDEQIDNVDALIEKNKKLKKGLMQTLLTKGIGHTKFKKTEIGEIPEEWSIKTIGDVINLIKSGLSRSLKDEDIGIPCIRSNNINNYKFDKSDLKYWFLEDNKGANINDYILREGDILVNFINSLAQIGKTCLYKDIGRPVIYTTNIFRMNLNEQIILNKYFYYISQTEMYNNEIKLITKPAVNQASFTVADFKSIKISVPPINEQIRIVSILSEVDEKVEESEEKKQKLEELKKGLMQQLLTGKIRV